MSRCQACGAETNGWIDVEDRGPEDDTRTHLGFRQAIVCLKCLDAMDADMWVCRAQWEALNPITPYEKLKELP